MRRLHPVGFTTDLDGLIFSTRKGSKSGGFVVAIGEDLMDKLREAERLRNGAASGPGSHPDRSAGDERDRDWDRDRDRDVHRDRDGRRIRPESALTPREIQSRLRAGRSIDDVAREAAVGREWVERFAAPILAEQGKVIELAQSLRFVKPRLGESTAPLGESVALNLLDRGVQLLDDDFDRGWSAFQLHDRIWTVRFLYRSRGRSQQASWNLDLGDRSVSARDRLASDLGYLPPGRRKGAARGLDNGEVEPPEPAPVDAAPPGRRGGAVAAPRRPAAPPRAGAPAPTPASGPKKAAARKAKAKPKPTVAKAAKAAKATKAGAAKTRTPAKAAKAARVAKAAKAAKSPRPAKRAATPAAKRAAPAPKKAAAVPKKAKAVPKKARPVAKPSRPVAKKAAVPAKKAAATRARATPPRFGTDGSRLATPAPQPARRSASRSSGAARATPAAAPSPQPARRPADTGERQPPRRFDTNPRPSTPRAAAIVERLSAMRRPASQSSPSPFAPRGDGPERPKEPPAIAITPIEAPAGERDKPDDDAFVIRPRISAKQASELASPGS